MVPANTRRCCVGGRVLFVLSITLLSSERLTPNTPTLYRRATTQSDYEVIIVSQLR